MTENEIGTMMLDAAFKVHKVLGPGLLESAYEACLEFEIRQRGLMLDNQVPLPLFTRKLKWSAGTALTC